MHAEDEEIVGSTDHAELAARYGPELAGIFRHWSRKSEMGKGIRLSPAELDILNAIGAGELIARAAAEAQREKAAKRLRNQ